MGSLSLVVFKHRLYDQLLRNVRGDLSIGFGSVGVFWSEDSEALSYMVMSFFCQVKLSGSLQLALTVLIPSLCHSGFVLGISTVYLKMTPCSEFILP